MSMTWTRATHRRSDLSEHAHQGPGPARGRAFELPVASSSHLTQRQITPQEIPGSPCLCEDDGGSPRHDVARPRGICAIKKTSAFQPLLTSTQC
eukprot:4141471-Prymnesium_polylepis.1